MNKQCDNYRVTANITNNNYRLPTKNLVYVLQQLWVLRFAEILRQWNYCTIQQWNRKAEDGSSCRAQNMTNLLYCRTAQFLWTLSWTLCRDLVSRRPAYCWHNVYHTSYSSCPVRGDRMKLLYIGLYFVDTLIVSYFIISIPRIN